MLPEFIEYAGPNCGLFSALKRFFHCGVCIGCGFCFGVQKRILPSAGRTYLKNSQIKKITIAATKKASIAPIMISEVKKPVIAKPTISIFAQVQPATPKPTRKNGCIARSRCIFLTCDKAIAQKP